ncbi:MULTISPECIES: cobalt-precorrin-8X methylmutase [Nostocales]|uniref:Cobalt-precorrin-8X methylmutase n=3 Tax=Nostocales TaxID=1161 RepID=A0A0C1R119_9CYAN|nr:cobalt-precorrin-8X methylmutase [Tolypothrix bouteillei]KAF3887383.1 cobalt-precorrin-8X methylmutase [Tolypothrix bouteillei VB521301]
MNLPIHPIMEQSFAVIDSEIGDHNFTSAEYAIVRRVIHSTADFEFKHLIQFSEKAIQVGIEALHRRVPIVTDVGMVKQGVAGLVAQTFGNPLISAVEIAQTPLPGKTRTETGLLQCYKEFPEAIFAIGNAPTALLALCQQLTTPSVQLPALVIGAPVGFISVVESKAALANTTVHQIRVEGRKGGSPVAAAIVNALITLAWEC